MATKLKKLIDAEAKAADAGEDDQSSTVPAGVKVTRGHDRAKTLQIRLSHEELGELTALAETRGLPVSTVARQLLLQSLNPVDDLQAALDRLERDVSEVRRRALSA
jgi:predicted DNA-binding protein